MANTSLRMGLACHGMAMLMLCLFMLATMAAATQFKVGGSMGWTVPTDPNAMTYNQWASKLRFKIGDSLLFVYLPDKDSVLQVTNEDYSACKTSSPLATFDDGNTVFTFNRSGPYYFISGFQDNCLKNESMVVVVLADRSNSGKNQPGAPAPTSPTVPSPPPPPPPPPPTNAAPLKVVGVMSSIGAFLGLSLLFSI